MMIKFVGAEALNNKLKQMVAKCPTEMTRFMKMEAEVVKGRTKGLTPIDTGRLRNSWSSTVSGHEATIFTNTYYAPFVEFGHRIVAWGHDTGRVQPGVHMLRDAVDGSAGSFAADAEQILARIFN